MGMLDSLIEQLEESPAIAKAMAQVNEFRAILVATVNRFDQRFGAIENVVVAEGQALQRIETKVDRMLFLLEYPSKQAPAGDDGLMKALANSGQEMIVKETFEPIPVKHESEVTN